MCIGNVVSTGFYIQENIPESYKHQYK